MTTDMGQPTRETTCVRCGESIAPGTPLYSDHIRTADGRLLCAECARTERGVVEPDARPDVPITQPNPNLPNTH